MDDSPEPAVEMSGGSEARDPDPGAGSVHRSELAEGLPGRLEALVGGELAEPGCLGEVQRDPGAFKIFFRVHHPEVVLRLGAPLVGGAPVPPHRLGVVLRDPGAPRATEGSHKPARSPLACPRRGGQIA